VLKVVVLGYGDLAQSIILGILKSRHRIVGALRWNRNFIKDVFLPDSHLALIRANNIREIRAKRANTTQFVREIKKLAPDVIIVGSWGEIIKKEIFDLPKVAFINAHPSLLPKHRGSNPYSSVIRHGETETGLTFHLMEEKIDTGSILMQEKITIADDDTAGSLRLKCALKAKDMVVPLLDGLEKGEIIPRKQNNDEASYYPNFRDVDIMINWNNPADFIHRQIRALLPGVVCFTAHKGSFLVVNQSEIVEIGASYSLPGRILEKNGNNLLVSTSDRDKALLIKNVRVFCFLPKIMSARYLKNSLMAGDLLS